jgi:hypothetical protein
MNVHPFVPLLALGLLITAPLAGAVPPAPPGLDSVPMPPVFPLKLTIGHDCVKVDPTHSPPVWEDPGAC